ncbi:MAG: hypothetical protein ABI296_10860, partial [Gammaproteobacteria bacterium]
MMKNRTSLEIWNALLQSKEEKKLNSKNSYVLSLAQDIEALRVEEQIAAHEKIKAIIERYTDITVSLDIDNFTLREKIKEAKTKLHSQLTPYNKTCKNHEAHVAALEKKHPDYLTALCKKRELYAARAILHLLEPLKNYNKTMLMDWYQRYELLHPSFETAFNNVGIGKKYFDSFLTLDRRQAGKNIPDIRIEGSTYSDPDYYLRKLNVATDMKDAVLAATLGKHTSCCQSYSGESGHSCTEHGLTSPDGGFYVLFKKTNERDSVHAQAWTWRNKNNICFDSIEAPDSFSQSIDENRAATLFTALAAAFITGDYHIDTVTNGYNKSFSQNIGQFSTYAFFPARLDRSTYRGHIDSKKQNLLIDSRLLTSTTYDREFKKLNTTPLHDIQKLVFTLGYTIKNDIQSIADNLIEKSYELKVNHLLEQYNDIQKQFLAEQQDYCKTPDEKKMITFIETHPVDIHLFNVETSIFIHAAKNGHAHLVDLILAKNIYVDIPDEHGMTAL